MSEATLAHTHRLRDISIQAMVEGSARARLGRAMNTHATMPAQKLNLKVGEEVDFYRSQTSKDASGWFGPAEVTDISRATRGVITVRWQSRTMDIQLPNVRRHLHFLALLTAQEDLELAFPTVYSNVWTSIWTTADSLSKGSLVQVGFLQRGDRWISVAGNSRFPELFSVVKFFAENHLQLTGVVAARLGHGVRELPPLKGYTSSMVLLWRPGATYSRIVTLDCVDQDTGRSRISQDYDDWSRLFVLQVLMADSEPGEELNQAVTSEPAAGPESDPSQLTTIPEAVSYTHLTLPTKA